MTRCRDCSHPFHGTPVLGQIAPCGNCWYCSDDAAAIIRRNNAEADKAARWERTP